MRPGLFVRIDVCVLAVLLVGSASSGFAQATPRGVPICDIPAYRGTAIYNKYCGACYPHCGEGGNTNYENPRIGQAYAINEQGRQALTNKEFDKAAALFRQAYATYPDPVYKQNEQLALSQKRSAVSQAHFDRGQSAYEASNWKVAIDEYQRSITFAGPGDDSEAAKNNIRLAHFNQDMDWYRQKLKAKRYKEAALYLREANQWNRNPNLAEDLKDTRNHGGAGQCRGCVRGKELCRCRKVFCAPARPRSNVSLCVAHAWQLHHV